MIFTGLGGLLLIVSVVCWVILLIAAFKAEVWKGIAGFFCGLYLLYFAITEYQADNKWLIVGGCFGSGILANLLFMMGRSMGAH